MRKKTRALTLTAVLTAMSVVVMFLTSLWPTGQLAFAALASFSVAVASVEAGVVYGIGAYAAGAALGLLLLPDKAVALLFALFFGYYPIIKGLIERIRIPRRLAREAARWALKLLVFNAVLTVMLLFLRELMFGYIEEMPAVPVVYLLGSAVFVLYDYGYSKVIWYYMEHLSKRIMRK